ncbi:MAG: BRO family protein [Methylococcales bacterium]
MISQAYAHKVETTLSDFGDQGNPWFCARDICAVLDITWSGHTLDNMPENWFMVVSYTTIKGERDTIFISEPGLYFLVFRSNKPKAVEFVNWVCGEVLPSIRKSGFFGKLQTTTQYIAYIKAVGDLVKSLGKCKDKFQFAMQFEQLRVLCNMAGQPIPNVNLLGVELKQDDLHQFIESGFTRGDK